MAKNYLNATELKPFVMEHLKSINVKTELFPYLSEQEIFIFKNCIAKKTISNLSKFEIEHNFKTKISAIILGIYRKIERIFYKKQQISKLEKRYGGKESLMDLSTLLSQKQQKIFNECVLSIDPHCELTFSKKYNEHHNMFSNEILYRIPKRLDAFYNAKLTSKAFIKKYGGEDFLIHDFASSLDRMYTNPETYETFLINVLMDYHYSAEKDIKSLIKNLNQINMDFIKNSIIDKLEIFIKRKKIIDTLLDKINISEFDNYLHSLNKLREDILLENLIAYAPISILKLGKKYDLYTTTISDIKDKLKNEINELAGGNCEKNIEELENTTYLKKNKGRSRK